MKKRLGNTSIELFMVMLILILFSITTYGLLEAGIHTQQKILNQKSAQVDARIALSFINKRLRQNDENGKIQIKKFGKNEKNAIVIQNRGEYDYDTWIYFNDGRIMECIKDISEEPNGLEGTEIARVKDFYVSYNNKGNSIVSRIFYENGGQIELLENIITLASA